MINDHIGDEETSVYRRYGRRKGSLVVKEKPGGEPSRDAMSRLSYPSQEKEGQMAVVTTCGMGRATRWGST